MNQNIATIGSHLKELTRLAVLSKIGVHELQKVVRREMVIEAMTSCRGNQCHAAHLLGCHRNTLCRMLDAENLPSSIGKVKKPQQGVAIKPRSAVA